MSIRVGLIGPRRSRTGSGPFVARILAARGCQVFEWGREQARLWCVNRQPTVDAVAICSPPETHFPYIAAALDAGVPVFCEKPLVWPSDHSAAALRAMVTELDARAPGDLLIHENTQWPYTLDEYRGMTGEFAPVEVRKFACVFAPSGAEPAEMVMETASHANSLLLATGCRGMDEVEVDYRPRAGGRPAQMDVRFESRAAGGAPVAVHYRFEQCERQPRTAAYAVNGRWVWRRIGSPGYQISFEHNGRLARIGDPMEHSVEEFARNIQARVARRASGGLPPLIRDNLTMSAALLEHIARYKPRGGDARFSGETF